MRTAYQPDPDFVVEEHLQNLFGTSRAHRHVDARVVAAKRFEDTRQNIRADRQRRADTQVAEFGITQRLECVLAFLYVLECPFGVLQIGLAGVGELHGATRPLEQILAQLTLERLDAGAHGWLCQVQDLSRFAEAVVRRNLHKGLKLRQVDHDRTAIPESLLCGHTVAQCRAYGGGITPGLRTSTSPRTRA